MGRGLGGNWCSIDEVGGAGTNRCSIDGVGGLVVTGAALVGAID